MAIFFRINYKVINILHKFVYLVEKVTKFKYSLEVVLELKVQRSLKFFKFEFTNQKP